MAHDPVARRWLDEQLEGSPFRENGAQADPLMEPVQALVIAREAPPAPAEVMLSWHRLIASTKTALRQSETGFVEVARRSGWTEARIAAVLNIHDQTVDERLADLDIAATEEHPSRNPIPWTGADEPQQAVAEQA